MKSRKQRKPVAQVDSPAGVNPSRTRLPALAILLFALVPGFWIPIEAARRPTHRAVLVSAQGETEMIEVSKLRFVHYRRRLAKWGRWETPLEGGRPRVKVKLAPQDDRYESNYLLWESPDIRGIRLKNLCEIRFFYKERSEREELFLEITTKKGRTAEYAFLDLLDAYQPEPIHFAGVVAGQKKDLPILPLLEGQRRSPDPVLTHLFFDFKYCRE